MRKSAKKTGENTQKLTKIRKSADFLGKIAKNTHFLSMFLRVLAQTVHSGQAKSFNHRGCRARRKNSITNSNDQNTKRRDSMLAVISGRCPVAGSVIFGGGVFVQKRPKGGRYN